MRDNSWLKKELEYLLKTYFNDIVITNPIEIKFGREAKFRFGSIRLVKPRGIKSLKLLMSLKSLKNTQPQKSIITITSMFASEAIPVDVVRYTISHELCHYAHGFSSSNKQLFKHPHHGGVVNRELDKRGAHHLTVEFKKWLKQYKKKILAGRERL